MEIINKRRALFIDVISVVDGSIIIAAASIALNLRYGNWMPPVEFGLLIIIVLFTYLAYMKIYDGFQNFQPEQSRIGLSMLLIGIIVAFSSLFAVVFFLKMSSEFSRLWIGYWGGLSLIMLIMSRIIIILVLRGTGHGNIFLPQITVFISDNSIGRELLSKLRRKEGEKKIQIFQVYYYGDSFNGSIENAMPSGKGLDKLIEGIRRVKPDCLILALSELDKLQLGKELDKVQELCVSILEFPTESKIIPIREASFISWVIYLELPFKQLWVQPFGNRGWLYKSIEDFLLGWVIFIASLPLMALISFAVKLTSKGPVFFKQIRHGFNGEEILVYKFRSMAHTTKGSGAYQQATKFDSRITKFGMFLRKTSLDELPQLINVIKGEMSLVGPRPHPIELNNTFSKNIDMYFARHRVKPGITGWAQVNGWRGETETKDKMLGRIKCDLYYINNWSLFFDLRILCMTLFLGFINKNAY